MFRVYLSDIENMRDIKRFIAVVTICFCSTIVCAESVSRQMAEVIAAKVAGELFPAKVRSMSNNLSLIYAPLLEQPIQTRSTNSYPAFYVYNVADRGYVIVAGDNRVKPILAYSATDTFSISKIPVNLSRHLDMYMKEIAFAVSLPTVSDEIEQLWNKVFDAESSIGETVVRHNTVLWNQTSPYNYYCPSSSVTGCVATTMGIVMKYYNYPERGKGSNSYTSSTNKYMLSESFDVAYEWNNMLYTYKASYTTAQRNAVAQLLYHCGVSVNMDYTPNGSGANVADMIWALKNNFSYDEGIYLARRNLHTDDEWHKIIQDELNAGRLVPYSGLTQNGGGHIFLLDGYTATNYYHVNWGWGESGNGYYLLSVLGSNEQQMYNSDQDAVIGVTPAQQDSYPRYEIFFADTDEEESFGLTMTKIFNSYYVQSTMVCDYALMDFEGKFALFHVDKYGNLKENLHTWNISMPRNHAWSLSHAVTVRPKGNIAPGDKMELYYTTDSIPWKKIVAEPGGVDALILKEDESDMDNLSYSPCTVEWYDNILKLTSSLPIKQMCIYTETGVVTMMRTFDGARKVNVLHDLTPGVYIVCITTDNGVSTQKIVKK